MTHLDLQDDEAAALEALLDKILTNKAASEVLFDSGAERRSVKRVSMKLHWSKSGVENASQAA